MASSTRRKPVTPEDLKELVFVSDPQIDPRWAQGPLHPQDHRRTQQVRNQPVDGPTVRGKTAKQFTHGPRDGQGRWSPDGSRIAFISARDKDQPQIHLIDAEGGEARTLTDLPQGSLAEFAWSPDGRKIAFSNSDNARRSGPARRSRNARNRRDDASPRNQ